MAIDLIKRWKLNRQKYKEKHVPFVRVKLKSGYEVPKYNYLFGKFEEIVNEITQTYLDNGLKQLNLLLQLDLYQFLDLNIVNHLVIS